MEEFMKIAIEEAKKCGVDVPVGAAIVLNGKVIASAHNVRECDQNPIGHAEIIAIARAAEFLGSRRLSGAEIYVTLEPCPMCSGAILLSGISKIFFGAYDRQYGCVASRYALTMDKHFHASVPFVGGIMEQECKKLLDDFFNGLRKRETDI